MAVIWLTALSLLKRFGSWLGSLNIWQAACIALALFAGIQTIRVKAEQRHSAKSDAALVKCSEARKQDQDAYRKAQADAATENKAQVAKVEQQYQRNSDNEREAYLRDLAKLRADRVRNSTAKGSAGPTGTPSPHAPTGGADADGLPVPQPGDVQEEAAEIELRLMHLQNWVREQLKVDPNK